jgi:hypothetical protein
VPAADLLVAAAVARAAGVAAPASPVVAAHLSTRI